MHHEGPSVAHLATRLGSNSRKDAKAAKKQKKFPNLAPWREEYPNPIKICVPHAPCLPVSLSLFCLLSSVGDHLAKSAAEFSYGTVMDEVRMLIQRRRLAVNDRQQRAVAFGKDRKRGGGLYL